MEKKEEILRVRNLDISFETTAGEVNAVRGVNLTVNRGETVAIVGESGSGKSVSAKAIMGILAKNGTIDRGQIAFSYYRNPEERVTREILQMKKEEIRRHINGKRIAMVFQDPMTSLNPLMPVGKQIMEGMIWHYHTPKEEAYKKALELMKLVGITDAEKRIKNYPHQLSGGMRQRIVIAIALACDPELLICDEPTTALDVTIQAQILDLLHELKDEFHTSIMLITHDMGVVAEMADHVMVMYAGKSVEYGTAEDIFDHPMHPYTVGLLKSIPKLGSGQEDHLFTIEGTVPGLDEMPAGCRFSTRCPYATEQCKKEDPGMQGEAGHFVRCFRFMDPEIQDSREVE